MQDVHDQVAEGAGLDEALARHPRVFSELTVSMVRAGMEGAFLEDALRRVASFLERQEELKSRVLGAMAYPIFLAVVGSIVTTVLVVVFVPKFEPLFDRLQRTGGGLPAATTMLLWLSDFLGRYGLFVLLAAAGLLWAARHRLAAPGARRWVDRTKLKLPIAGKIFHNSAVSRFCRVLGTLLRNGVPILKALQISSESSGNRLLAEAIVESAENVSSGESLSRPLADSGLVPPTVMAMISVAEEANTLDSVLINVADRIDQRIERQLSLMVRLIEPVMLVLIGGVVLFVLVALLLPVIEASTTVG
jgi:general secretion pathway protein F/type IV pilus assembly protein PilC